MSKFNISKRLYIQANALKFPNRYIKFRLKKKYPKPLKIIIYISIDYKKVFRAEAQFFYVIQEINIFLIPIYGNTTIIVNKLAKSKILNLLNG